MKTPFAVALFDFDGVILQSSPIKVQGFLDCFESEPAEALETIRAYATVHGGVSRFDKFRHIYKRILNRPLSEACLVELCAKYSERVFERVAAAPFVNGVRTLLDAIHTETHCYVVSGTPQDEVRELVKRRGIAHYFRDVVGSPASKAELTRAIVARHDDSSRLVFIGDAITDYDAAKSCGIAFLGVAAEGNRDVFPPDVVVVDDLREYRFQFLPEARN